MATDYRAEARRAAKRYGLDPHIFERQIGVESVDYAPDVISGRRSSPAGAQGIAQIMPATAKGWGVDPLDPIAALNAAAKNMAAYVKKYGGYENALRAYNAGPGAIQASHGYAETNNYVKRILNGRSPTGLGTPSASTPSPLGSTPTAATGSSGSGQAAAPVLGDPGRAGDVTGLLQSLISKPQPVAQAQAVAPPMFSARPSLPQGVQLAAPQTSQAPEQSGGVEGALSLLQTLGGTDPASAAPSAADATGGPQEPVVATVRRQRADAKAAGGLVPLGGSQNAGKGAFKISGPDPGRLQKGLTTFADQVASIYGGTLEGLDGSTHSKYTVNGNVSEHYSGNATDIFKIDGKPATGLRLMRAGRAALIAAGMPREKALKAPGGLYNVGNHQIIFGVSGDQYGGDHTDHLHISTHPHVGT